jgi:hypothetical protein
MSFVRGTAGVVARQLVVLFTLGTSIPVAAHRETGHDPCDGTSRGSASATSVSADVDTPVSQHCEVCHWLRALRTFEIVAAPPVSPAAQGRHHSPLGESVVARLSVARAPSRAPPA